MTAEEGPAGAPRRGRAGEEPFGLPAVWLRHNCPCGRCQDARSGQRLVSITDVAADVSVVAVRRSGSRVAVEFGPDGHQGVFDTGWLAGFAAAGGERGPSRRPGGPGTGWAGEDDGRTEDAKLLWSAGEVAARLPQGWWPLFVSDTAHRQACLTAVLRDGFVVLGRVPREHGAVAAVARSVSFVRETERGRVMNITARPELADPAFSRRPIPPCTAQAFRDPAPTLHLAHVLDSAAEGGEITLVDGFGVAAMLRDQDLAAFGVLAGTTVAFAYADARARLRAAGPIIGTDPDGRIRQIRYSSMSMQPVRLPPAQIETFYAAYRTFAELAGRRDMMLTLRLRPGQCLITDNTRILAGRAGFAETANRRVQVCWADIDAAASALALIQHPGGNGTARCLTRSHVIARTGCGLPHRHEPGRTPAISWAKLAAMSEDAKLASRELLRAG
jgi:gamma-butyrobetaine dioxygenase